MRFVHVLALASAALTACDSGSECETRADCDDGLICVNGMCELDTSDDDAGMDDAGMDDAGMDDAGMDDAGMDDAGMDDAGAMDGGMSDAGMSDAGMSDAGMSDAGPPPCTRVCGDVDLDRDGDRDDADFAALASSVSDACVLLAADADLDGDYDAIDEHALRALATGRAVGPCADCGACGDVDASGAIADADATLTAAAVGTTPTICTIATADVNRDSMVDDRDARLVQAMADGSALVECASCGARACGDHNANGTVSVIDVGGITSVALNGTALSPCTFLASDVVADGIIDRRDAYAAQRVVGYEGASPPLTGACETCLGNGRCGDVNDDGAVNSADSTVIRNRGLDASAGDVCDRALADLNADGALDGRDSNIVAWTFVGLVPAAERCPICSLTCGDVNQDGMLSAADRTASTAIRGGAMTSICERNGADVNADAQIDLRDDRLMQFILGATVSTSCGVCTHVCGDANQDGIVNVSDRSRITEIVTSGRLPTPCEMDDADVDFDGDVDTNDRDRVTDIINGTPPAMPCGR